MTPKPACSLFFLHQQAPGSRHEGQLSTAARAHVARQARLRLARQPRGLTFIPYSPVVAHGDGSAVDTDEAMRRSSQSLTTADPRLGISEAIPPTPAKSGALDPFDSLAVPSPTQDEKFLLSYAFRRTLPAFGESETHRRHFAHAWIQRAVEFPMVFYSQILGASTHYLISSADVPADVQSRIIARGIQHKVRAIRALRSKIEEYQPGISEVDDGVFHAIFLLAIHGTFDTTDQPEPHPLSPLATCRDVHIYGRMKFGREHINALFYLVAQKGGISNVDQHAYGYVLPLFDIVHNIRIDAPPAFPYLRQVKPLHGSWTPDAEAHRMLADSGKYLRPSPDVSYLDSRMDKIFQGMSEITVALDHYCRGGPGAPPSLNDLLSQCDWVTHMLLSTPRYIHWTEYGPKPPPDLDTVLALYEIGRLCALLYIDMVMIPSPPHTGVKLRNSAKVLHLLEAIQPEPDDNVSQFLSWATILGAICARFTGVQDRYRSLVEKIALDMAWDVVHPRLQGYLWFGPVFDGPARGIWSEAQKRAAG